MTDHTPGLAVPLQHPLEQVLYEVKQVIVGQDLLLERLLVALLARGHVLVEGVPGLAKTLAVKSLAAAVGGQFQRVQFTPDLVPADLVGTRVYDQSSGEFRTWFGPVYFRKESEPYLTIAVRGGSDDGPVTIADVNLKFIWDVVSRIRIGEKGKAYVVDANGFLVADPDIGLVLRKTNLGTLPHVRAPIDAGKVDESAMVSTDLAGAPTLTSVAYIEPLAWRVFVEQPIRMSRKHPAILIPAICRLLESEHPSVFKREGKLFTGPARPHPLTTDAVLAERPQAIVEWLEKNPTAKLADLWKGVLPEGETEASKEWLADLFWLLTQGHVLLFADDTLVLPRRRAPQGDKPGAATKAGAPAVKAAKKKKKKRKRKSRGPKVAVPSHAKTVRTISRLSPGKLRTLRGPDLLWRRRLEKRGKSAALVEED